MSVESDQTIYLRCDAPADWSKDGRCTVTHSRHNPLPDNAECLEVLARRARRDGWTMTLANEGLKGIAVKALCPDHGEATP